MELTSISRKISGPDYSNISLSATLGPDDDPIEVAKQLDVKLHKMLQAINQQADEALKKRNEQQKAVSILERALEQAKKDDGIPF